MKNNKKLNEGMFKPIRINTMALVSDYPELDGEIDNIAYYLSRFGEVELEGEDGTIMSISNIPYDKIIEYFEEAHNVDNLEDYYATPVNESIMEDFYDDFDPFDTVDDYEMDDEDYDNLEYMNNRGSVPAPEFDDDIYEDDEEVEFDDDDALNDSSFDDEIFNECDEFVEDDEFVDECGSADCFEDEEFLDECGENCDDEFCEDDEFDECLHESVLNKKKSCCPPVKGRKLVNLNESLKQMRKTERRKTMRINESIFNRAMDKVKAKSLTKKERIQKALKEQMGEARFNNIIKALKEHRDSLYTKKTINGKNIQEYSGKELYAIYKDVLEQIKELNTKVLNESVSEDITNKLNMKKRLLDILDEELTYRVTIKKYLNEDEEPATSETSTESNEETSTEDTTDTPAEDTASETSEESTEETTEDPEKDEEVELARVIITVANQEAADDLKKELVDAGIPEDVIEFETESDEEEESEETSEESTDETSTEDTTEETTEGGEESTESTEANESLHVNTFRKLLEDEETETPAEEPATEGESEESTEGAEGESEDAADDKPVKVILTDTDHVETLAKVLSDVYGIEQEEFEEMIGGSIVTDEEGSDKTSEESTEDEEKKDDESNEDKPSSNGDDAVDNMSDEDLAALFGDA